MSQDHQGRRAHQVSQDGQDPQVNQEYLDSLDPKVNQVLQELDHQDNLDPRYRAQPLKFQKSEKIKSANLSNSLCVSHRVNQASQGSQEPQDSRELQDHPVSQVYQDHQVPKGTLASQDSKVIQKPSSEKILKKVTRAGDTAEVHTVYNDFHV